MALPYGILLLIECTWQYMKWKVEFTRDAAKQRKKLERSGTKPCITDIIDFLAYDLEDHGPQLKTWHNFGLISGGKNGSYYHCHMKKGQPTYVACWRVINENTIEVFYVGTHEGAPYQKS